MYSTLIISIIMYSTCTSTVHNYMYSRCTCTCTSTVHNYMYSTCTSTVHDM